MSADSTTHSLGDCSPERVLRRVDEAICGFDADWRLTFVNDQAATILEHSPDELLGQRIQDVAPNIDETVGSDQLQEAMSTGTSTRFEHYDEDLDRWFKIRIYPDEDGATACFYDITEERGEQLEVQRQRRLFETVFEETEDALVVADTDRRITDFNPAAEQLFGYEASEALGEKTRLLYADDEEYARQGDQRFNEQAPMREETYLAEYERADGTTFIGETLGTSLKDPDGETLAFLGSVRDVSSRIEYEQEMQAHNAALQAFHDIATDDDRSVGERIDAVLELGTDYLGLDVGILSAIDGDEYTVEHVDDPDGTVRPGDRFDLVETYCASVVGSGELVAEASVGDSELATHPAYRTQGLESYIGTSVVLDSECYGTLNFSQPESRKQSFTQGERTFVRVLAQWIGKELSRHRNKQRAAANRDRLRQIIDLLPQLVFAKDRHNEYILANQAIADAYGSTVEDVEGSTDADFVSSAAEAEQFRQDDLAVMDSGEPKHIPEEPLTKADGETVTLQTIKIPYDPVDHDTEAVLGVATDITEMTEQRRQLEETTQRLNVALEGTNTGVWEMDIDTEAVVWTDSMASLVGIDLDSFGGSFEAFANHVHPEDLPAVREAVDHAIETGSSFQHEYRITRGDDTHRWVEARAELVGRDDGSRQLVGIATDITDRKRRDTEIELQSAAMEVAMDGIAILDGDEYVYMNQAHADVFEYDPEELLGREWRDLYGDDEIDRLEAEVFPELADTGSWRGETTGRKRDGTPVQQDLGLALLDTGELICTNRDITERKEREAELRRSREFIEKAQESASIGGWEVDLESDSLQWTDEVYRIHELPIDTTVDLGDGLEFYHSGDRPEIEAAFDRLVTDGEPYDLELRIVTAEDRVRWVRAVGDPQFDADGTVVGAVGVFQDITERREREVELREVKERLDLAVEGANLGVWDWDMETDGVTFNEQWASMLGLSLDEIEPRLDTWEDRVHPADMAGVEAALEAHIAGDEALYDCEHRMRTESDEWRWIRDVGKVVDRDGDGTPTRAVGIHLDITEQKRLEASLRESEQSLRELTSIASDTDREFEAKLTALLELGVERLGLPYGFITRIDEDTQHVVQAVGDHPELQTGASAPKSQSYCRKTIEQSTPLTVQNAVTEGWERDPAYERFDLGCYIGGRVTVDGSLYGTLCFAGRQGRDHEFTETERTFVELLVQWISYELSRAAVETKLRQINETGQQFMSVPSKEQIASLAIESAESILELSAIGLWWYDDERDALVPERMTDAATAYVSEQPVFERGTALAWEAFDTGEVRVYDDLSAVDGMYNEQTAFTSETIVPLGSHGVLCAGSVDYQTFSETEISLLEVLSSTVEAALARAEREAELREIQAALKQSNEELEQFAYAASHDLQEPLRTVSSYLTLLERRYSEDLDEDATEFIEFAVDGADRMRNMIQALLAYSRVDTRGQSFEAVALSECFEQVTGSLGVKIAETGATVSTPSTTATVRGDPSQLAQLFQNLVDNAITYNTGQPEVDISVTRHDGLVTIDVRDNGIGMEADQIDEIFEVFQRLHTREEFDGTGIGLSICRKIVDRHGGDIEVVSQPEEGSTFTITLPEGGPADA